MDSGSDYKWIGKILIWQYAQEKLKNMFHEISPLPERCRATPVDINQNIQTTVEFQ